MYFTHKPTPVVAAFVMKKAWLLKTGIGEPHS